MKCPLCGRALVKRYRVTQMMGRRLSNGRRAKRTMYVPLWYCTQHKFTVEINHPSRPLVTKRPARTKRRSPGSAAE